MTTDGGLWGCIKDHMKTVHWQRVETGGTGRGIPDLNGCLDGVESWVELKATSAWAVGIRPEQVAWTERRLRAGGRVYLATRRRHNGGPMKGPPVDEIWIHHGRDIRQILMMGLQLATPPLYRGGGGPSQWLWPVIESILFE